MINVKSNIVFLTQISLLIAIEFIVCFTPLGSIPIGPVVMTLSHLPVIVAAIVLGRKAGVLLGFIFGLFSFIVWTFIPPSPVAFAFTPFYSIGAVQGNLWSLVICFVPRILIGFVAAYTFELLSKNTTNKTLAYVVSGVLGTLVNTFLVLGGIYIFFGPAYATALDMGYELLLGAFGAVILTNGIPEAILGGVVALAVCLPLKKYVVSKAH